MKHLITKTIDLNSGTPQEKREEIRDYFLKTWALDELLYTQLKSDDVFYHRGDPLRHIILFYLGHTAAFYINKFMLAKMIHERVNPEFESIFAIGVDEMSWDDLNNSHYDWPAVADVRLFRDRVKEVVLGVIDEAPLDMPIAKESRFWVVLMGIEHQRIHIETSSVLIRQLPPEEVVPGRFGKPCTVYGSSPRNELVEVPGRTVWLGKPEGHRFYGWDNEYGSRSEDVQAFKAARYLTSNAEFLTFIEDGGYHEPSYWTEEGWQWRTYKEAEMPLFWRLVAGRYRLRLVAGEIDMPWNWPVEVNYLEAKAFCNWKSAKTGCPFRMPTEAEWYALYEEAGVADADAWVKAPGNINLEYYSSSCPVDMFAHGSFFDVIGNVWQWTETPITGYPGFEVHPVYDDFSTPTFDGKHNLIKGGSWISTGNEATRHARYAFRRHFYQHAGFRYIQTDVPVNILRNDYETDPEVTPVCEKDWGDAFAPVPNFYKELAGRIRSLLGDRPEARLLDLNADTGRLAFELAPYYSDITALDFTARMLQMAIRLQDHGGMRYTMKDENDLVFYREVLLASLGLGAGAGHITFMQADVNNLKPFYRGYDLIVLPQMLHLLAKPRAFLSALHERLNPGGRLVIASDYIWTTRQTAHRAWLGGYKKDGEPLTALDALRKVLAPWFEQEREPEELLLTMPETSRLYTVSRQQVTFWKKR